MATTNFADHLPSGTHAARPAATAVPEGTLYACSDHDLVYQSNGSAWATWLDATGATPALGAWTGYTPALTASATNPTLGSSTIAGRYKLIDTTTLAFSVFLNIDTTGWNPGSGDYQFSLPSGVTGAGGIRQAVAGHILDSGTRRYACVGFVGSGSGLVGLTVVADAAGTAQLGHNVPVTWATGDYVVLSGVIEVAVT